VTALAGLFLFSRSLGPGLSLPLAMVPPFSTAAALFLAIGDLPEDRPALRRVGAILLAIGGVALLLGTPFYAMGLVALASP
jgi:hypothetical protein